MSDETHWVLIFSPSLNRGRWKLSNCMDGKSLLMQISDYPCNWKCESAIISWHYMLIGHIRCWKQLRKHPWVSKETSVGENQPRKHPDVEISGGSIRGWKTSEDLQQYRSAVMYCKQLLEGEGGRGCKLISGQMSGSTSSASVA